MKKIITKTKTKIAPKTVVVVLVCVTLAAATVIVATASGTSLPFGLATTKPSRPPLQGWCVTGLGLIGSNGMHTTLQNCVWRENDDNESTQWYAWCPDIEGQGMRDSCTCNDKDIVKSSELARLIGLRSSLIDRVNDGNLSTQDIKDFLGFGIASNLHCACGIWSAGNSPSDSKKIMTFSAPPMIVRDRVTSDKLQGTFRLIAAASKMFSRMNHMKSTPGPVVTKYCTIFPDGLDQSSCEISGSYDPNRDNSGSAHIYGEAIDINCFESATPGNTHPACGPITEQMKGALGGGGFNIIEECNAEQRKCAGTSGAQVIHLDLKDRGGGEEGCLLTHPDGTCTWTCD